MSVFLHQVFFIYPESGLRLRLLSVCVQVYPVMKECWLPLPAQRKKPQAIMRDMNQMLYKVTHCAIMQRFPPAHIASLVTAMYIAELGHSV